jgi:hypothetical protein
MARAQQSKSTSWCSSIFAACKDPTLSFRIGSRSAMRKCGKGRAVEREFAWAAFVDTCDARMLQASALLPSASVRSGACWATDHAPLSHAPDKRKPGSDGAAGSSASAEPVGGGANAHPHQGRCNG